MFPFDNIINPYTESVEKYRIRYNRLKDIQALMTFILGVRCDKGVVLVADKKITVRNEIGSISFDYKNKLHNGLRHVVFGVSGSTDTFEFFVDDIKQKIKQGVTIDDVTNVIAEHVLAINKARDFYSEWRFDLLVAVQHPNKPTSLTYITSFGGKREIEKHHSIGIGSAFATPFLEIAWNSNMKMSKAAELGYFIIKYIEDYKLHSSVGINGEIPQIWYIPDEEKELGEKIDYEINPKTRPNEFGQIQNNVNKNFKKYKKQLEKLFM